VGQKWRMQWQLDHGRGGCEEWPVESDLWQLPDAMSLLINVVNDIISQFDALGPFAVTQNGKISAHVTLFSDYTF
jgi:hypothetical protein